MDHRKEDQLRDDSQARLKRVILLKDLEAVSGKITGGADKLYFGESQFDA